jgi:hypothetical protein
LCGDPFNNLNNIRSENRFDGHTAYPGVLLSLLPAHHLWPSQARVSLLQADTGGSAGGGIAQGG